MGKKILSPTDGWSLYAIVTRLIGPIQPTEDYPEAYQRFENLAATMKLVEQLTDDLLRLANEDHDFLTNKKRSVEFIQLNLLSLRYELDDLPGEEG